MQTTAVTSPGVPSQRVRPSRSLWQMIPAQTVSRAWRHSTDHARTHAHTHVHIVRTTSTRDRPGRSGPAECCPSLLTLPQTHSTLSAGVITLTPVLMINMTRKHDRRAPCGVAGSYATSGRRDGAGRLSMTSMRMCRGACPDNCGGFECQYPYPARWFRRVSEQCCITN